MYRMLLFVYFVYNDISFSLSLYKVGSKIISKVNAFMPNRISVSKKPVSLSSNTLNSILITMMVEELYDLLLPFYIERKEFTEEYVRHLINFKIGLYDYNEEKHVNLNVLDCIFNSGIDIKQLEGMSDKELLKLIYMIQSNRDVKQMCKQIDRNIEIDIENKQENIEVEEELKENLKEFVKQQLDLVKEKDIEMKMEQLANELSQVKEENLELKEFKEKYYELIEQNKNKTQAIGIKKRISKIVCAVYCKIRQLFKKFFCHASDYEK